MSATQKNRPIAVETPLGEDVLLLQNFAYSEEISRPFLLNLEMQSERRTVDFRGILGQKVTVKVFLPKGGTRYLNGFVSTFRQTGFEGDLTTYEAVVVPWLQLLDLSADCRIFQMMTVPEILKKVFSDAGYSDFRMGLTATYETRGVCVQYRESHLDFVSRLMEEEGISYFFEHTDGKHTLVLADSTTSHTAFPGHDEIDYRPQSADQAAIERVYDWKSQASLASASVVLNDYDYVAPRMSLVCTAKATVGDPPSLGEYYDVPGKYELSSEGDALAKIRLQALQCRQVVFEGKAKSAGLSAGYVISLKGTPAGVCDADYLLTSASLEVRSADFRTATVDSEAPGIDCRFSAIPAATVFRPPLRTAKPRIAGLQTAVVTGPAGNDPKVPFVSAMGSVKVKFRWDRSSAEDDSCSGWIRVSHISAGNGWGSVFLPRIGNEVLVAFEEGDPDRPVVVGSVYNAVNMPSLPLPQFAQRCYIHDDGGNVICFAPETGCQSIVLYSPYKNTMRVVGAADEAAYKNIPTQPSFP